MRKYVLALDQGTTSSRAIVFDRKKRVVGIASCEFTQIYPSPGYVEHDPFEILASQKTAMSKAISESGISPSEIACIGITNQRETTVVWDRETGKPVCNAIVWQCRRTSEICESLKARGMSGIISSITGLRPDAYFSATKIKWILDNVENARERAEKGKLAFGTVDSWLIWNLTGCREHVTDRTNASRTMLYDIHSDCFSTYICDMLGIPMSMLPEVKNSFADFGYTEIDGVKIPICGVAGDQQAALFGQGCFARGQAKNTYGTGCFLLMNTGEEAFESKNGLLTTAAVGLNGKKCFALEGSVFTGGAVVQWLRDELRIIGSASESELLARRVENSLNVYLVPAFTGLGAPYWDMYARGTITGITRGTKAEHIVRAALESIAYQSAELLHATESDMGGSISELRADGGASENGFLMQFQSDILGIPVFRPAMRETTALGAALIAGLQNGFYDEKDAEASFAEEGMRFYPTIDAAEREKLMNGWKKAVSRALSGEDGK